MDQDAVPAIHRRITGRSTFSLTVGFSALVCALVKESEVESPDFDPLELSFYGLTFGQVAAISFGTLVFSQEFHHSALRVSLSAVPRRGVFYASKMAMTGGVVLAVGLLSGFTTLLLGQALIGEAGIGISDTGALRAAVGSGIYLALMALFAAGLTALLRSGVAVLSVLIPLLLLVPFIFTDFASGVGELSTEPGRPIAGAAIPAGSDRALDRAGRDRALGLRGGAGRMVRRQPPGCVTRGDSALVVYTDQVLQLGQSGSFGSNSRCSTNGEHALTDAQLLEGGLDALVLLGKKCAEFVPGEQRIRPAVPGQFRLPLRSLFQLAECADQPISFDGRDARRGDHAAPVGEDHVDSGFGQGGRVHIRHAASSPDTAKHPKLARI